MRASFTPFQNEADCLQIADLTLENRLDRVSLYGSIDLTKDREGLALAEQLKAVLDAVVTEMRISDLPDRIAIAAEETVDNPFG
jgi:hypothetical protein